MGPLNLFQNIIQGSEPVINRTIPIRTISETEVEESDALDSFNHAFPLGISPGFAETGRLVALAIADEKQCLIIEIQRQRSGNGKKINPPSQAVQKARQLLQEKVLCRDAGDIFAFDMGPLAMSLHTDLNIRITNAVDIQCAFSAVERKPIDAMKAALGDSIKINENNVRTLFLHPVYDHEDRHRHSELSMRAWISQFLPSFKDGAIQFNEVKRINTKDFHPQVSTVAP